MPCRSPHSPGGTQAPGAEAESSFPGWGFAGEQHGIGARKAHVCRSGRTTHPRLSQGRAGDQEQGLVGGRWAKAGRGTGMADGGALLTSVAR